MPSCLGLYIENNIIKYAKVTKERDTVKLDAFGVKFYDRLEETIGQIISETFSYNIPISVNLNDERYNYFEMFSLLNDKDMSKAISTEFELLCEEKGYNKNNLETRYVLVNNQENREKIKAMHISCNKAEISKLSQAFQKYKLRFILPIPIAIANDLEFGVKENAAILNLEEKATLTTIINGQVNKVDILEKGMNDIYEKINKEENSYAKVYDILKNTTIYTSEGKDLSEESNNYLQYIMPTLYDIVSAVKEHISQNINNIENLYITGTGAVINNIDLYFQEYMNNTRCEILKPYFTKKISSNMSNIKDYIEVNSAIGLCFKKGLGEGIKTINFKATGGLEKLKELGNTQINGDSLKGIFKISGKEGKTINDLSGKFTRIGTTINRTAGAIAIAIIVYTICALTIANMLNTKIIETDDVISDTEMQIEEITTNTQKINDKTAQYASLIEKLDEINQRIADENSVKNSIPNLMSRIMVKVPKNLQITSIRNTTSKHVVIDVQALEYDPIGYFLGAINTNGILVNAKSNSSVKQNGIIKITIEGDMP